MTGAVRVMRVDFHVGAPIKRVQSPKQTLQGIGLEEGVILGYTRNIYRELIIWNKQHEILQLSSIVEIEKYFKMIEESGAEGTYSKNRKTKRDISKIEEYPLQAFKTR